ncbi:hypothetical protein JO972_00285 [Verrucomicrobiaceae bacterium 5K15]|nr:hypothetical protein [Oceaniferula flavus]
MIQKLHKGPPELTNTHHKMNFPKILPIICLLIFSKTSLAQGSYDIAPLNNLVDALLLKKIDEAAIDAPSLNQLFNDDADFVAIQTKCKTDWSDIMDNLSSINGGDKGRDLVLRTMQAMTANDYMSLLEKTATLYVANTINDDVMKVIVLPTGRMRAFVTDNYQNTRMSTALNTLKTKSNDANFKAAMTQILSGDAKTAMDAFRAAYTETSLGNVPTILIP